MITAQQARQRDYDRALKAHNNAVDRLERAKKRYLGPYERTLDRTYARLQETQKALYRP